MSIKWVGSKNTSSQLLFRECWTSTYLWPEILWNLFRFHVWRDVDPDDLHVRTKRSVLLQNEDLLTHTVLLGWLSATSNAHEPAPYPQSRTSLTQFTGGNINFPSNTMSNSLCCALSLSFSSCLCLSLETLLIGGSVL